MTSEQLQNVGGPQNLCHWLISVSGEAQGVYAVLDTVKIGAKVDFSTPTVWNPEDNAAVKIAATNASVVAWDGDIKYSYVPGPGIQGRAVTLHACWVPPGHQIPTTEEEFGKMPGYQVRTFGGASDPNYNAGWHDIPFSTSRHNVIVSNVVKLTSPMKLCWAVEVSDIATTAGKGALFRLQINGRVRSYGSFL